MNIKKAISLLLIGVLTVGLFAGCDSDNNVIETTTTAEISTTAETTLQEVTAETTTTADSTQATTTKAVTTTSEITTTEAVTTTSEITTTEAVTTIATETGPTVVTELIVDGTAFTFGSLDLHPWFVPSNMPDGYMAFNVTFNYPKSDMGNIDNQMHKLYEDGYFMVDGVKAVSGSASSGTEEPFYTLLSSCPAISDTSSIEFHYDNNILVIQ